MKDILAANRYAQALFDIGKMTHLDMEIEEELVAFCSALKQSPEMDSFLKNPYFDLENKVKFLEKMYQKRAHEVYYYLLNFFTVLLEKGRFYLIHEIKDNFLRIADQERGVGLAEIRTAVPLEATQEAAIVKRLEKIAGYKISVRKEVDPALLGGVVVKIRYKVLDGSVKHKIEALKKELTRIKTI